MLAANYLMNEFTHFTAAIQLLNACMHDSLIIPYFSLFMATSFRSFEWGYLHYGLLLWPVTLPVTGGLGHRP